MTTETGVKHGPDDRGVEASDRALLESVGQGDATALRALYERHAPWLVVRLARRCSDPNIVEEVVQDTFVAVWRRPQAYGGGGEVAAWIWGIGIRRLIDRLRTRRRVSAWRTFDP